MDQIAEGVRLNCNPFNPKSVREMLIVGVGVAVGYEPSEIATFLALPEEVIWQMGEAMNRAVPKGQRDTASAILVRQDGETVVDTVPMMLYRKFRLVANYLAIVSNGYTCSDPYRHGE